MTDHPPQWEPITREMRGKPDWPILLWSASMNYTPYVRFTGRPTWAELRGEGWTHYMRTMNWNEL